MQTELEIKKEQRSIIETMGCEQRAMDLVISNHEDAQMASNISTDLAKRIDRIKVVYADLIAPAKLMVENAKKYCDPALKDAEAAREITKAKLVEWNEKEQKRIAEEKAKQEAEQRKIQQEAAEKAAKIEAKARAEAEAKEREAEEAAAREEAARKAGDLKAQKEAAEEKAKAEAKKAKILENAEAKSFDVQTKAATEISTQKEIKQTKIAGSSVRTKWVAELEFGVSEEKARMMIIKAAASDSPELAALLQIDMKAVNKLAAALEKSMSVPGFRADKKMIAVGSRK